MKKYFFILAAFALILSACGSKSEKALSDYADMNEVFTEQEVEDLQLFLNLFEHEIGIQDGTSNKNKTSGYSVFNTQIASSVNGTANEYPISIELRTKLLDVLHVSTFRSIWGLGVTRRESGMMHPAFSLRPSGKFVQLLAETGKDYPLFLDLHKDFVAAGDISPTYFSKLFVEKFDELDFSDTRVRLIYAISCISSGMPTEIYN